MTEQLLAKMEKELRVVIDYARSVVNSVDCDELNGDELIGDCYEDPEKLRELRDALEVIDEYDLAAALLIKRGPCNEVAT